MNIVLVNPQIPQNTGNIVRTCAATDCNLHLVEPLGFSIEDRYLKRAGLDYWNECNIKTYKCFEEVFYKNKNSNFYFCTTKALKNYADVIYAPNDFLVFGSETSGLPEELLIQEKERCIRIPMKQSIRSLNLSNSVAIVLFEALRQTGFDNMNLKGNLTKYSWDD